MKIVKINSSILIIFIITLLMSSCKKEETGISEEEAAALIAVSLSSTSNGLNYRIYVDDSLVASEGINCGETKVKSDTITNPIGSISTYSYRSNLTRSLACTSTQTLSTTINANGNFDAPRVLASDNVTASWTTSGYESTSSTLSFNGNYKRSGSATSKILRLATYSFTLNTNATNLIYNKSQNKITSGSAAVILTGETTFRGSFNYSASIEFIGNDLAKININGTVYTVNLITGQIV